MLRYSWVPGVEIGRKSSGDKTKARTLLLFPVGRISVAQGFVNLKQCNQSGELPIKPVLLKVTILVKMLNLDSSFQ